MNLSEAELDKLETEFALRSGQVFQAARHQALAAGLSVVEAKDGVVYRLFPDGRREEIKRIERPVSTRPGTRIQIR